MRLYLKPLAGILCLTLAAATAPPASAQDGPPPSTSATPPPAPPPAALDVTSTLAHVERLQMEIADLTEQRRQYGLAGPIVAVSVGGVMLTYGLIGLLMLSETCDEELPCSTGMKTVVGALTVGGLIATVLGATTLSERMRERRRLGYDINVRKHQLNLMQNRLRWNVQVTTQLQSASVGFVF